MIRNLLPLVSSLNSFGTIEIVQSHCHVKCKIMHVLQELNNSFLLRRERERAVTSATARTVSQIPHLDDQRSLGIYPTMGTWFVTSTRRMFQRQGCPNVRKTNTIAVRTSSGMGDTLEPFWNVDPKVQTGIWTSEERWRVTNKLNMSGSRDKQTWSPLLGTYSTLLVLLMNLVDSLQIYDNAFS